MARCQHTVGVAVADARAEPGRTADGHHIVVDGRRWRATDPSIPPDLRAELVSALMAARRAVKADDGARAAVHDAKVALGERGEAWWEPTTSEGRIDRHERAARALLRHRGKDAVVSVSELATLSPASGTSEAEASAAVGRLTGRPGATEVRHADLVGG